MKVGLSKVVELVRVWGRQQGTMRGSRVEVEEDLMA
jgi:hypothetical protein